MTDENPDKPWHDAATLRRLYVHEDESMAAIATQFNVAPTTIEYWLTKHDITDSGRGTSMNVKLTGDAHTRLKAHCREGETLSGCVERALDALDRETALPDAITDELEAQA